MKSEGQYELPLVTDLDKLPVAEVPIHSLLASDSPRRSGEDPEHVRALAEVDTPLPPLVVHRSSMRVIDGMHRLHAAQLRGMQSIEVRFVDGDEASSFVLAVKANIAHGLPLSLVDRKAATAKIIGSYPHWSDRVVASVTGLSARTVAMIRGRLTDANPQLDTRVGRDGRERPVNSAQRRARAAQLLSENPEASLREIAREAQISPETVRRVRARLASGMDTSRDTSHVSAGRPSGRLPREEVADTRGGFAPRSSARPGIRRSNGRVMLQSLRADPALRSSERGRTLLQMLAAWQVIEQNGEQIMDAVPLHCLARIAEAARGCAAAWERIAMSAEGRAKGTAV